MGAIGSLFISVGVRDDLTRGFARIENNVMRSASRITKGFDNVAKGGAKAAGGGFGKAAGMAGSAALGAASAIPGLGGVVSGAISGGMAAGPAGALVGGATAAITSGVEELGSAWHRVRDEMSSIAELSRSADALGVTAAALTGLEVAAGPAADHVTTALFRFEHELGAAAEGSSEAKGKFAALGLSVDELSKLKPEEAFGKFADQIKGLPSAAARAQGAMGVLGRHAAMPMLPMLSKGSEGIQKGMDKAAGFGLAPTPAEAAMVEKANGAFKDIDRSLKGVWTRAAIELSPALEKMAGMFPALAGVAGPVFHELGEYLGGVADVALELRDTLRPLFDEAVTWFKSLGLSWPGTREVTIKSLEIIGMGFAGLYDRVTTTGSGILKHFVSPVLSGLAEIMRGLGKTLAGFEKLPGSVGKGFGFISKELLAGADAAKASSEGLKHVGAGGGAAKGVHDFFDRVRGRKGNEPAPDAGPPGDDPQFKLKADIEALNDEMRKHIATIGMSADQTKIWALQQRGASDEMLAMSRHLELVGKGMDLAEKQRPGLEKLRKEFVDIGEAADAADLSDEERGGAYLDLLKGHDIGGEVKLAGGAEAGSSAAQSILNRAGTQTASDPVAKLQQLIQAQAASDAKRAQEAREVVQAIKDGKISFNQQGL